MVCHTMKYGGYAIMLWSAIISDRLTTLVKCPIKLSSEAYQIVLDAGFGELYDSSDIFMQNNDPCHKSAAILGYLDQKEVGLLSDWPQQSPDLYMSNTKETSLSKVSKKFQRTMGHCKGGKGKHSK